MGDLGKIEALGSEIIKNDDDNNVVPHASEEFVFTSHTCTQFDG